MTSRSRSTVLGGAFRCAAAVGMLVGIAAAAMAQDPASTPEDARSTANALTHGIDAEPLKKLLERARASASDAVVLVRDDAPLSTWRFGKEEGPIEAMSATKSVVALAIGRLLADGRLESLDVPVHRFFPEWNQGRKAAITVRHLLTQRSGLQCDRVTTEIYRSPDFVQLAFAAELAEEPGKQFRYNNKAVNLLAGIVQRVSGTRMDELLGEELFEPMGITDWDWSLDAAGNPHGMSGLQIRPEDLAKIGQLMLDGGVFEKTRLLPESYVREAVTDQVRPANLDDVEKISELYGPRYGLLWWPQDEPEFAITDRLLSQWRQLGVPEAFVTKMATLKDVRGPELRPRAVELAGGEDAWNQTTWMAGRPDFDIVAFRNVGFSAEGYLGQYLVVVPARRLVAVRMRRAPDGPFDERKIDSLRDFKELVAALARE